MSIIILVLLLLLIIYIYRFVKKYNITLVQDNEYKVLQNKKMDILLKKIDTIAKDTTKVKNKTLNGK